MGTTKKQAAAPDRFIRQQDLVPREKLTSLKTTVIGVGAIGRQVAIQLGALGVTRLQLIDFDSVELHNVTTQAYLSADIGEPKVSATANAVSQIEPSIVVEQIHDRFRAKTETGTAVFCCVDSISSREAIWKHLQRRTDFWAGFVVGVCWVVVGAF